MLWILILNFLLQPSFAHEACRETRSSSLLSIAGFMDQVDRYLCRTPEDKPVLVTDNTSFVPRKYKITKLSDTKYIAEVNLMFLDSRNGIDKVTGKQVLALTNLYRPKVQECLNQYNQYLKGPNGEALTIKLSNDQKIMHHVFLADKGKRANSSSYPEEFSCGEAIHEILHLMGLADEYPEKQKGYIIDKTTRQAMAVDKDAEILRFDCRATGPKDSIMHNHEDALSAVLPQYRHEVCVCDTKDKQLDSILMCNRQNEDWNKSNQSFKKCPFGTTKQTFTSPSDKRDFTTLYLKGPKEIPPKRESLLEPAHFRYITQPHCSSVNRHYKECAQFSYQTSLELPENRCAARAEKCKQDASWLR